MSKLVFGMNQSLDGYVDHMAFAPGPTLFRHFIEEARGHRPATWAAAPIGPIDTVASLRSQGLTKNTERALFMSRAAQKMPSSWRTAARCAQPGSDVKRPGTLWNPELKPVLGLRRIASM